MGLLAMTDIVERLRDGMEYIGLRGEAADEIERLRAQHTIEHVQSFHDLVRAKALEEAARCCDECYSAEEAARVIRALKDRP